MPLIGLDVLNRYVSNAASLNWEPAVQEATEIVQAFTGDRYIYDGLDSRDTVWVETNAQGFADLPYAYRGAHQTSDPAVYDATNSRSLTDPEFSIDQGRYARLNLTNSAGSYNLLVVGQEPWRAFTGRLSSRRLRVTANWGDYAPLAVQDAVALIAAGILARQNSATELTDNGAELLGAPASNVTSISVEGFSTTYRAPANPTATTGITTVDQALTPYRRTKRQRWS